MGETIFEKSIISTVTRIILRKTSLKVQWSRNDLDVINAHILKRKLKSRLDNSHSQNFSQKNHKKTVFPPCKIFILIYK